MLLIITDGEINDMEPTKQALVLAVQQPLSIIIVGVGSAEFTSMKILDRVVVTLPTAPVQRDIVQFVE